MRRGQNKLTTPGIELQLSSHHGEADDHLINLRKLKFITRYVFAALFVLAGLNHFLNAAFYLKIMPPYLPQPLSLVYLSGLCEMALGFTLFFSNYARLAAWGLILLLIAVFPANLHMALHPELFPEYSHLALLIRLPLQGVLIAWAFWYTRP